MISCGKNKKEKYWWFNNYPKEGFEKKNDLIISGEQRIKEGFQNKEFVRSWMVFKESGREWMEKHVLN